MPPPNATARGMVEFLNQSWTPYHAVEAGKKMLTDAGFEEIDERDEWKGLKPGGKYFFTRQMSTLIAFAVGKKYQPGDPFVMLGAHTDSPCPKLKPKTAQSQEGYVQIAVQPYGGGLWHTWFDRDLGLAGRAIVKRKGGELSHELLKIDRPILRIPSLAIHLDRTANEKFHVNFQTMMAPVIATELRLKQGIAVPSSKKRKAEEGPKDDTPAKEEKAAHHPAFLAAVAKELGCAPADILDFDLQLCDVQPSVIGGLEEEFVLSGRLDNLASSYICLRSLVDSCGSLGSESAVRLVALYDHEECGSDSAQGAGSPVTMDTIRRVVLSFGGSMAEQAVERTIRRSFMVSADMAHGVHPNFGAKHEPGHKPQMHRGSVLKVNANQRYATDAVTASLWKECGNLASVPHQEFVVRSDMGCGSTIGPIISCGTGIRTVDCGAPMLGMHSVRETCGVDDCEYSYKHYRSVLENFVALDRKLKVDGL